LEPAAAARCVITGAHTFNFNAIVCSFLEQHALVQLPATGESEAPEVLARAMRDLLADGDERRRIGLNARAALEQNRGATSRTVEMLAPLFKQKPEVSNRMPVKDKVLTSNL
ncbi:MAG: hypothetical protein LC754_13695, partial [Acidobacteria bacterium]|nr:hypothetical protein [Acidobacteriota bacterium]